MRYSVGFPFGRYENFSSSALYPHQHSIGRCKGQQTFLLTENHFFQAYHEPQPGEGFDIFDGLSSPMVFIECQVLPEALERIFKMIR